MGGGVGSLTVPAWKSSAGARAWESNHQVLEAPSPLVFAQNDTQTGIKLQKTPRDGAEHRKGEAEAEGTGGIITRRHHSRLAWERSGSQGWKGG